MSQEVSSFPKSTQIKTNDLTHGPLGEQSRSNHSSVLLHFRARIGETKEEALTIGENCEEIAPHSVILCVCVCASMQHMPKHHAEATTQKSECYLEAVSARCGFVWSVSLSYSSPELCFTSHTICPLWRVQPSDFYLLAYSQSCTIIISIISRLFHTPK